MTSEFNPGRTDELPTAAQGVEIQSAQTNGAAPASPVENPQFSDGNVADVPRAPSLALTPHGVGRTGIIAAEGVGAILAGVGDVVYEWTPGDDRLVWSDNVLEAFGLPDMEAISTGRRFASFLCPQNTSTRYDAVMDTQSVDEGSGVPFQVTYRILPKGRENDEGCWLEDTGRWYVGSDGKPARVMGVLRRIDERYEHEQQLAQLSYYDPLTSDLNRSRLAEILGQAIENTEATKKPCAFLLAAIDNLAMINDAFGFDVADQVIAAVSTRIKSRMRGDDSIGRYAGNKFGLVLLECDEDDMEVAAHRLLDSVRKSVIDTAVGPVAATISIGGVALPKHARTVQECWTRAEEVLEQAKSRHMDSFVAYEHSERRESIRKRNIMLADEIVSALNDRRLNIAYQPIVDAQTAAPAFYECLLRMTKPDGSVVSAGHFISVAEQIGLVRMLDHRVFELVLNTVKTHPDLTLSFNVSGVTANDPAWLANFTACLKAHSVLTERLTVEITETAAIQDINETVRFVNAVRDLGCKVAIDDFGAGYTSFKNLKLLDVDMVKIDGGFVDRLHESADNQFFVRTLIDLAKNFDIKTVAEWVCDERDVALLREMGIDYLQGFLYGAASLEVPGVSHARRATDQAEPVLPAEAVMGAGAGQAVLAAQAGAMPAVVDAVASSQAIATAQSPAVSVQPAAELPGEAPALNFAQSGPDEQARDVAEASQGQGWMIPAVPEAADKTLAMVPDVASLVEAEKPAVPAQPGTLAQSGLPAQSDMPAVAETQSSEPGRSEPREEIAGPSAGDATPHPAQQAHMPSPSPSEAHAAPQIAPQIAPQAVPQPAPPQPVQHAEPPRAATAQPPMPSQPPAVAQPPAAPENVHNAPLPPARSEPEPSAKAATDDEVDTLEALLASITGRGVAP